MEESEGQPPPENQRLQKWQIIFFPGFFGGGRALTAIRQELEELKHSGTTVINPSSISTPEGAEPFPARYRQIIEKLNNEKNLLVIGHSLGATEVLELLREINRSNENFPKIVAVLISPVGTEVSKSINLLRKLFRLMRDVSYAEQHIAFPTVEGFYQGKSEEIKSDYWNDDENKREERRISFLNHFGNEKIKGKKLKEIIAEIDKHILEALGNNNKKQLRKLLKKRGRILGPFIQRLFTGKHIDEKTHQQFMEFYGDVLDKRSLFYLANLIRYLFNTLPIFLNGQLLKKLQQNCNDIIIVIIGQERDCVISPKDLEMLKKLHPEIPEGSFSTLPQLAHSSIGYYPQPLMEIIKKLINKLINNLNR